MSASSHKHANHPLKSEDQSPVYPKDGIPGSYTMGATRLSSFNAHHQIAPATTHHVSGPLPMPGTTGYLPTYLAQVSQPQADFTNQNTASISPITHPLPITAEYSPIQAMSSFPGYPSIPTTPLTNQLPGVTRQLSLDQTTAKRALTYIPATTRRQPATPPKTLPRKHRPAVFLGTLFSCLAILLLSALFVAPLSTGRQTLTFAQKISSILANSQSSSSIDIPQHVMTPTPTLALMTNEGYCGGTDIWGKCATAITTSGVIGTGTMQSPLNGAVITQAFGLPEYQSWCGCTKPHSGIDLATDYGTPVTAADSGEVIWRGWDWSGLGWAVKISHGHYIATIYGHLARYIVNIGDTVKKGDVIAYEGSTGASTGPHLHFMVLVNNRWLDPTNYMALP